MSTYMSLKITFNVGKVQPCDSPLDWARDETLITLKPSHHTFRDGSGQQQGASDGNTGRNTAKSEPLQLHHSHKVRKCVCGKDFPF